MPARDRTKPATLDAAAASTAAAIHGAFEPSTLALLLAGSLAYTGGTLFYLNRRIRYSHAIWHLFVMAGSAWRAQHPEEDLYFEEVPTQGLSVRRTLPFPLA
ncbi:MAG: hypothetical protein WAZ99_02955 [Rectinemataceae bacterium]